MNPESDSEHAGMLQGSSALVPEHTLNAHNDAVHSCTFSHSGACLLSTGGDIFERYLAILWDTTSWQPHVTLRQHTGSVRVGAFAPDDSWCITVSSDGTLRQWDVASGRERRVFHTGRRSLACAVSPDGRRIAADASTGIIVWEGQEWQTSRMIGTDSPFIFTLAFLTTNVVIAGHVDGTASLWNLADGSTRNWYVDYDSVTRCAAAPSGTWFVTCAGSSLGLWTAMGTKLCTIETGQEVGLMSCAISRDERWIATGDLDGVCKLWDARLGQELQAVRMGHERVTGCAISPDGRFLVTTSLDDMVRVWPIHIA